MKNISLTLLGIFNVVIFFSSCTMEDTLKQIEITDDMENTDNLMNVYNTDVYYVSTSGSDSNNGLSASCPFKTLAKATSMIRNPGDSVLLKCGDMWIGERIEIVDIQGTPAEPIIISSYGTGTAPAIISNTTFSAISIINSSGYVIDNLIFINNQYAVNLIYPYRNGREYVRVKNCRFTGGSSAVRFSGDYQNSVQTGYDYNVKDIRIENCVSTGTGSFLNCEVFTSAPQVDFTTYSIWDLNVVNCQITSCKETSILARWIKGGSVDGCTLLDCYTSQAENGSCGILLRRTEKFNVKNTEVGYVHRNKVDGPDGEAIDFEGHCVDCVVSDCYLHHCDGPAMMYFYTLNASGARVKYNKRCHVVNNTFHLNNQNALHPEDCELWISDPLSDGQSIISGNKYTKVPGVSFYLSRPNVTPNIVLSNNLAVDDGGEFEWKFNGSTSGIPEISSHNEIVAVKKLDTCIEMDIDASLNSNPPAFAFDDSHFYNLDVGLNINTVDNNMAVIIIKNKTPATKLSLYWETSLTGTYPVSNSQTIDIEPNSDSFVSYTFDLGSMSTWMGNIEKVKLVWSDFVSGTGVVYIDNFKIGKDLPLIDGLRY